MAAWLNGYTALWHPGVLWQAKGPPRCESQYDHEQPLAGCIYALPESPQLYMPDDWPERVAIPDSIWSTAAAALAGAAAALAGDPGDWAGGWRLNGPARLRLIADGDQQSERSVSLPASDLQPS